MLWRFIVFIFTLQISFISANTDIEQTKPRDQSQRLLSTLEGMPSTIVNSVNIVTGEYNVSCIDAVLPGAHPLTMERVYSSHKDEMISVFARSQENITNGWHLNHEQSLFIDIADSKFYGLTRQGYGLELLFEKPCSFNGLEGAASISEKVIKKGLTNTGAGELSGRTNVKNQRIFKDPKDPKRYKMKLGSGNEKTYRTTRSKDAPQENELVSWEFPLYKEHWPNGSLVRYAYDSAARILAIHAIGGSTKELSSFHFSYPEKKKFKNEPCIELKTSDGRSIKYEFKRHSEKYYLSKVNPLHSPEEKYSYDFIGGEFPYLLVKREVGTGFQLIDYYSQKHEYMAGRVSQLKAPVGTDATPILTNRFNYLLNISTKGHHPGNYTLLNGTTEVYDAYGSKTCYDYDKNSRITSIRRFSGPTLYNQENFYWGSGPNESHLIAKTFSSNGTVHFCRVFHYDASGNVIEEQLWGNLTGKNKAPLVITGGGLPIPNGCEIDIKKFVYSQDGLNLVLKEIEYRKTTSFSYVPNTDLLASSFVESNGAIKERKFCEYDSNGILVKQISDDGCTNDKNNLSGVTLRHIVRITPRKNIPIGLPEHVEEYCLDLKTGQEILVCKLVNQHSIEGNLLSQKHVDSTGKERFTLRWEYDRFGHVVKEVNALGQATLRQYDQNGNLTLEQGPRQDYHKELAYDFSNRLIKEKIVCKNGLQYVNGYRYDYMSRKTAFTDMYGNETRYIYDSFSRNIETHSPLTYDSNGNAIQHVIKTLYNELSQPIVSVDPNGNHTTFTYNLRGQPVTIQHPDGTWEKNEYSIDGLLISSEAKNGTKTLFTYDYKGRPIKKDQYTSTGQLLTTTSATFNAHNILSETDAMGHMTQYMYDLQGRLHKKIQGDRVTELSYDTLGRECKCANYSLSDPNDYSAVAKEYDLLNQIIAEQTEDKQGTVLVRTEFGYDADGNRTLVRKHTKTGIAETITTYNPLKQVESLTDAEGAITRTVYKLDFKNKQNQIVACTETTDPLGNIACIISDSTGKQQQIVRKNPLGHILQKRELFYDGCGNRTKAIDHLYHGNVLSGTIVSLWQYDSCHRPITHIEAAKAPEQRQTSLQYNQTGQRCALIKPSGIKVEYVYDALDRLVELKSSDKTVYYSFTYDLNNNPIKITDKSGKVTQRAYDQFGSILSEKLASDITLSYTYDSLGRPLAITLPDKTGFTYSYQSSLLREVCRTDQDKKIKYAHRYVEYDHSGTLLESQFGKIKTNFCYDKLSRCTQISHLNYSEKVTYDKAGNLTATTSQDIFGSTSSQYTYDQLYQLQKEQGTFTHTYEHDSCYNRLHKNGSKHNSNALHQLLTDSKSKYEYDLDGNLISKTDGNVTTKYSYDALNRLTNVSQGSDLTEYTYDSFHRRLGKRHNQIQTYYIYQGQDEIGECREDGKITHLRILGAGKGAEIGAAVAIEINNTCYTPIHDHSGSIVALLNSTTEKIAAAYRYSAFGETQTLVDEVANPWRFASKRYDEETGFIYFGRRYYNAEIGRWTTVDPIGDLDCINLYAYVQNSPLTHFDLYGLRSEKDRDAVTNRQSNGTWASRAWNMGKSAWKATGRAVAGFGKHAISVPIFRDTFEIIGSAMAGELDDYVPFYKQEHSHWGWYGEGGDPEDIILIANGILTSKDELLNRVREMSEALGCRIYYFYNASHGFASDIADCILQRYDFPTHSAEVFSQCLQSLYESVGPNGNVTVQTFSKSGETLNYLLRHNCLSRDQIERMNLVTYGCPCIIKDYGFKSFSQHYDVNDGIGWLDPIKFYSARKGNNCNVSFSDSHGPKFINHKYNEAYGDLALEHGAISRRR